MSNLQEFKEEELKKEHAYFIHNIFGKIVPIKDCGRVENRPCQKIQVLLNDAPYYLYRYDIGGMILIPETLQSISDDFDSVIEFGYSEDGIYYQEMSKKDDTISLESYDYLTEKDSEQPITMYHHTINCQTTKEEMEKVLKQNENNIELFFRRRNFHFLRKPDSKHIMTTIKRTPDKTIGYQIDGNKLEEAIKMIVEGKEPYEEIPDNDKTLFELLKTKSISKQKK